MSAASTEASAKADIDLGAIRAQTPGCGGTRDLIAAVEALRERVEQQDTIISVLEETLKESGVKRRASETRADELTGLLEKAVELIPMGTIEVERTEEDELVCEINDTLTKRKTL